MLSYINKKSIFRNNDSFTLIELLIVIGILAVLIAGVIVVLNPLEYLRQSRDTKRIADLISLDKSLGILETQGDIYLGTSTVVYVSIADTSDTCANLGLPTLPSGYSYSCVTSANLQNTDGTGWVPVDFSSGGITQFSSLPVDPTNTTSTRQYYTYIPGGSWHIASPLESTKYKLGGEGDKTSSDGGKYTGLYEVGSNKTLLPIDYGDSSLVGYWAFNEGTGETAYDISGSGNAGTLTNGPTWVTGKVSGALSFDGSDDYVDVTHSSSLVTNSEFTLQMWAYANTSVSALGLISKTNDNLPAPYDIYFNNGEFMSFILGNGDGNQGITDSGIEFENWQNWAFVYDGTNGMIYRNGSLVTGPTEVGDTEVGDTAQSLKIGSRNDFGTMMDGIVDDVRVYNRALDSTEIMAIYNSTK